MTEEDQPERKVLNGPGGVPVAINGVEGYSVPRDNHEPARFIGRGPAHGDEESPGRLNRTRQYQKWLPLVRVALQLGVYQPRSLRHFQAVGPLEISQAIRQLPGGGGVKGHASGL